MNDTSGGVYPARAERIAYFDPFSGSSGDMILGALVAAGLPLDALEVALRTLPLPAWTMRAEPVQRGAIAATRVHVESSEQDPPHRHLVGVLRIIEAGSLPGDAAGQARAIFTRLAEAEARVHGTTVDTIHFHEVGAADAILDICGAAAGLALLGIRDVYCGPLPLGDGYVQSAHGTLPLPAPATIELLARAGAPTVPHPARLELVTPTGAAILTTLARFERPAMRIDAVGYGAGGRTAPEPNALRLMLGRPLSVSHDGEAGDETLMMLESNLDDMNPQWMGHLFELLLARGALDITCAPVLMKKGRPGQVVSVLCRPEAVGALTDLLLHETTTLGVRRYEVRRTVAARRMQYVDTAFGPLPVKVRILAGRITGVTPEYEACRLAARAHHVPLAVVMSAAQAAAHPLLGRAAAELPGVDGDTGRP